MKKVLLTWLALTLISFFGTVKANASGLDAKARDLLIEKFEKLKVQLSQEDSSYISIVLRLADLHSEKARQEQNQEIASGCQNCTAGKQSRRRAIDLYNEVLPRLTVEQKNRVYMQLGHLYEMQDEVPKAVRLYEDGFNASSEPELKADILMALGELYFKRRQFESAKAHFSKALAIPELKRKSLASYRLAWSSYGLGNIGQGIEQLRTMLKTPALLTTNPNVGGLVSVDQQFKQEVSRDLATFLSKTTVDKNKIADLYELSEDSVKVETVTYLASELERLGKTAAAIEAWLFVETKQTNALPKLETAVHLAQLFKDVKEIDRSLSSMRQAISLYPKSCDSQLCKELHQRLRAYVIGWNKEEKLNPSVSLVEAYKLYLERFSDDVEMHIWLAQASQLRKDYGLAHSSYQAASIHQPIDSEERETSLLRMIEMAELSQQAPLLVEARNYYLANTRRHSRALEVKYQIAHDLYKVGDYQKASVALRQIALEPSGDVQLRMKAADLSLDALALLKDNVTIVAWAKEFSALWPKESQQYLSVANKATFNEVAKISEGGQNLELAWTRLESIDLSTADEAEKILYYKNKLILAEKLQKFSEARLAVNELLTFKSLSPEDQQFAFGRKAWLSELALDFKTALEATRQLKAPHVNETDKILKLAVFADLAGEESEAYYLAYIKNGTDEQKKMAMVEKLVRKSKNPMAEINKHKTLLQKNPELLADLLLDYADPKVLLSEKSLASTFSYKAAAKKAYLDLFEKLDQQIANHQLDVKTQTKLAASLKARIRLITQIEELLKSAIERVDWEDQLLAVHLLARESSRFHSEVMSLPIPEGLTDEQQGEYLTLLSQQAAPYQLRAQDLKGKIDEFWQNREALKVALERSSDREKVKDVFARERRHILAMAPENLKVELGAIEEKRSTASTLAASERQALEQARAEVRLNPMNRLALEKLYELEKATGSKEMAAYLQARIQSLASGNEKSEVR